MAGPSTFRFLGEERTITAAGDWNPRDLPRLWVYNLHYFDDLVGFDAETRGAWHEALIRRWIDENPPGEGAGWEPYPTSLRIVNWIKWTLAGNDLGDEGFHNLAVQVRWLLRRLERHLLGNHLWANAKALVFAGAFFQGPEAAGWLEKGLSLIGGELGEQILPDGGHFERSPMYHAIVLEDLLDLVQLASIYPGIIEGRVADRWRETAFRMLRWLQVMTHPDGGISFFNDAALGIAPSVADLVTYAGTVGVAPPVEPLERIEALPDSGYVRLQAGRACIIADVGPIGPDYLPGHAHADTLSFELSLGGRRVLVNGGTFTYEAGAERARQRGTASHNTMQVNGLDSSEVWSSFRVARRARPSEVRWGAEREELWLRGSHDGYSRLRGVGLVHRSWRLSGRGLVIEDRVDGCPRSAVVRFRAHPDYAFQIDRDAAGRLDIGAGDGAPGLRFEIRGTADPRVVSSTWHPGFGLSEPCEVLELHMGACALATVFSWQ